MAKLLKIWTGAELGNNYTPRNIAAHLNLKIVSSMQILSHRYLAYYFAAEKANKPPTPKQNCEDYSWSIIPSMLKI